MKIKYVADNGAIFDTKNECLEYEKQISATHIYEVEIYYSGYFGTFVEATSEEEAIQLARENVEFEYISFEETNSLAFIKN